jgi:hypothetical protein
MPKDNEVGAIWKKVNDRGEYFSLSLDLDALLVLTGGALGKVNLSAFPIEGEKAKPTAPDYRLKYYVKGGSSKPARAATPDAPQDPDDPIPF